VSYISLDVFLEIFEAILEIFLNGKSAFKFFTRISKLASSIAALSFVPSIKKTISPFSKFISFSI